MLIEPENLVMVLDHFGVGIEETRRRLEAGALPGELLLELVHEHGAGPVWLTLPPRIRSQARPTPTPDELPPRFWVSLILCTAAATLTAIPILDEMEWWPQAIAIALPLGAVAGGLIWTAPQRIYGVLVGLATVAGAFVAAHAAHWLGLPFGRISLLVTIFAGGTPPIMVGVALYQSQHRRRANQPDGF